MATYKHKDPLSFVQTKHTFTPSGPRGASTADIMKAWRCFVLAAAINYDEPFNVTFSCCQSGEQMKTSDDDIIESADVHIS